MSIAIGARWIVNETSRHMPKAMLKVLVGWDDAVEFELCNVMGAISF